MLSPGRKDESTFDKEESGRLLCVSSPFNFYFMMAAINFMSAITFTLSLFPLYFMSL